MKKIFFIWIIILVSVFFVSSAQNNNEEKISEEVYMNLDKNDEVNVIVKIKPGKSIFEIKTDSLEKAKEEIIEELGKKGEMRGYQDLVSVKVSEQELEKLKKNLDVEEISFSHQIKAFLQDSVPLVNATNVWPVQISGINITGTDETTCILDTGINFTHSALAGKNRSCVIDCYNKDCVENCSVGDDNGHGTHVAGIVAASGGIEGVAINADLIGLKVLDENGNGHQTSGTLDLMNAIDWCVENREAYNISIITMSLGTTSLYENYCDDTFSTTLTNSINNATSSNLSVIAATGNSGNFTSIASPACIENTTAVGWANKDDTINDNSNRNSITDLLAPGTNINSTWSNGEYNTQSGTSMAAPHVSAAFALVRQFFRLQNSREAIPIEIQNVFNNTGKLIDDNQSFLSFSRIDVFFALISLDNTAPEVNLILPQDNSLNTSQNQIFSCNATDSVQLENITLEIWKLGNLYYNETKITSERFSEIEFNTTLDKGNYEWNCLVYDYNNFAFASSNFSLYIGNISVSITEPSNNTLTNQQINFSCLSQTASIFNLINVTFSIWNSTRNLVYNATEDISGTSNSTIFEYNFDEDGSYVWNCLAYNNETEAASADSNFTITYDATAPIISGVSSSPSTTTATIIWTTDESSNSSVNYGTDVSLGSYSSNSSLITSHSISLSGLSSSTLYYYNVSSCDEASNCQVNGSYSFTTSSSNDDSGNGGSGGSSSTTTKTIAATSNITTPTNTNQTMANETKTASTVTDGANETFKTTKSINKSIEKPLDIIGITGAVVNAVKNKKILIYATPIFITAVLLILFRRRRTRKKQIEELLMKIKETKKLQKIIKKGRQKLKRIKEKGKKQGKNWRGKKK